MGDTGDQPSTVLGNQLRDRFEFLNKAPMMLIVEEAILRPESRNSVGSLLKAIGSGSKNQDQPATEALSRDDLNEVTFHDMEKAANSMRFKENTAVLLRLFASINAPVVIATEGLRWVLEDALTKLLQQECPNATEIIQRNTLVVGTELVFNHDNHNSPEACIMDFGTTFDFKTKTRLWDYRILADPQAQGHGLETLSAILGRNHEKVQLVTRLLQTTHALNLCMNERQATACQAFVPQGRVRKACLTYVMVPSTDSDDSSETDSDSDSDSDDDDDESACDRNVTLSLPHDSPIPVETMGAAMVSNWRHRHPNRGRHEVHAQQNGQQQQQRQQRQQRQERVPENGDSAGTSESAASEAVRQLQIVSGRTDGTTNTTHDSAVTSA